MPRTITEIDFIVATPPNVNGHAKLNEFSWHGALGLSDECDKVYRRAVKIRNVSGLEAAEKFFEKVGWRVVRAFVGVHGD